MRDRASSTRSDNVLAPDSTAFFSALDIVTLFQFRLLLPRWSSTNAAAQEPRMYPIWSPSNRVATCFSTRRSRLGSGLGGALGQCHTLGGELEPVDDGSENVGREFVGLDIHGS